MYYLKKKARLSSTVSTQQPQEARFSLSIHRRGAKHQKVVPSVPDGIPQPSVEAEITPPGRNHFLVQVLYHTCLTNGVQFIMEAAYFVIILAHNQAKLTCLAFSSMSIGTSYQ